MSQAWSVQLLSDSECYFSAEDAYVTHQFASKFTLPRYNMRKVEQKICAQLAPKNYIYSILYTSLGYFFYYVITESAVAKDS